MRALKCSLLVVCLSVSVVRAVVVTPVVVAPEQRLAGSELRHQVQHAQPLDLGEVPGRRQAISPRGFSKRQDGLDVDDRSGVRVVDDRGLRQTKTGRAGLQYPTPRGFQVQGHQQQDPAYNAAPRPGYSQQVQQRPQHEANKHQQNQHRQHTSPHGQRPRVKEGRPGRYVDGVVAGSQQVLIEPRRNDLVQEYSSTRRIRFPDDNAELVENQRESRREGEESSSYNREAALKSAYKKPHNADVERSQAKRRVEVYEVNDNGNIKQVTRTSPVEEDSDQPLEEAGSDFGPYIAQDIGELDDGYDGDIGERHIGGGRFIGGGYGGGYDKGTHYDKEKGKDYVAGHQSSQGEKGEKGYQNKEEHEKGGSEKHGKEENQASGFEKSGEKKGHVDEVNKYAKGHKQAEGEKGKEFVHTTGHKKGHKKSGFHTVHHKDEFKKDETFYDDEHDSGHQTKHGHAHEQHGQEEADSAKKGHHDSGYLEAQGGEKGEHEKGHHYHHQKGHKGERGQQAYHGQEADYAKKRGHSQGENFGHSEVGGGGLHY